MAGSLPLTPARLRSRDDGTVPVGLDLRRRERALVDAHLVDQALEPFAPDVVAADPQRAGRVQQTAGDGARRDLRPVDIEA
jgi:hypothetical protein